MHDKPLNQAELDMLDIIRQLHAEKGPFLRSTLSVVGRGRGLEVARPFNRLKLLGLVEEIECRPFFLKWLFGAKPIILLRPSAAALATAYTGDNDESARLPIEAPPPLGATVPITKTLPPLPEPLAVIELAPLPAAAEPIASPIPGPTEPEVAPPAPPKSAPTKPVRLAPDAYTDVIGGQPMAHVSNPLAADLDPELQDGLREMLDVLGMEMTVAGEAMISARMAKGASAGEALAQVALFAFAHAAHYDILAGGPMQAAVLRDYAIDVIRELEKLRDSGEIGAEPFERDMRAIWALADKESDRSQLVTELLADPIGGAAPPALLPEDVRGVAEHED